MSKRANPTLVGLFVIVALLLAVAAVVLFGSGRFFRDRYTYVLFFEETVDGLTVGAPVKFGGIQIGSVSRVVLRYDDRGNVQTPVYIEILQGDIEGEGPLTDDPDEVVQYFIDRGLRGELRSQSFVTGQLEVSLVIRPDVEPRLLGIEPDYLEIPTTRSAFAEFTESLERLRLDALIANINETMTSIRRTVDSLPLAATLDSLGAAIGDVRRTLRTYEEGGLSLVESADSTLSAFKRAADRTGPVMDEAEQLVRDIISAEGPLTYQLLTTLEELAGAARALRVLADFVERNPDAFIFGKGEPPDAEEH